MWFTTTSVIYYWNTRSRRGRDHMVVLFTTTYVMYYWNTRGRRGRDHMVMWFTTTSVIYYWNTRRRRYDICSCKSHHHMITITTAPCISVIYDICSCNSHHHMITITTSYNYICHILLKYKGPSWSWLYGGVIYNYICHILLKYKGRLWLWSFGGVVVVNHTTIWSRSQPPLVFQ
jgi:hypothetical protein